MRQNSKYGFPMERKHFRYCMSVKALVNPTMIAEGRKESTSNDLEVQQVAIYHFDTLDQRKRRADKCHIAHLSVRYKKHRTVKCAIYIYIYIYIYIHTYVAI